MYADHPKMASEALCDEGVTAWRMAVVGIDGCSTGWIAVALAADGRATAHYLPTIGSVADAIPDASVIGIDIPIGFARDQPRRADLEARAFLGKRRNSLFLTPPRSVLAAPDHATATRLSVELTGSGVSQQSFALRKKIFEVEAWLPEASCPVFEVHPEVCFAVLMGAPASASKKSWHGMVERRSALETAGIRLGDVPADVGRRAAVDDVLDAVVVAWTARRLRDGEARPFPAVPADRAASAEIAIWA